MPCTHKPWRKPAPLAKPSPGLPPPPGAQRPATRDWPEYWSPGGRQPDSSFVFRDSFEGGWVEDSWGAWVQPQRDSARSGLLGSQAVCAKVSYQVRAVHPI